jgi:hypothetical protein
MQLAEPSLRDSQDFEEGMEEVLKIEELY